MTDACNPTPLPTVYTTGSTDHATYPLSHTTLFRSDEMRPVSMSTEYLLTAEGSALIEVGNTRVLCAASVEESVPQFLRDRKSTRLNSSHGYISYAVFCLKKKNWMYTLLDMISFSVC